ncbi:MAG TPA: SDR family oxidoreductase [Steroidobacteraceae bacterium]|jgi:NAD(P)-dependent dehydrogenase (short-subunit alcohol dehydrogenase family)
MSRSDSSKVALVTGASRGIGRVIALQLAQRGVRVALHYRNNREAAEASLKNLPGSGHASFDADLSDPREASLLWQRVTDSLGAVDILINNAGLYIFHPPLKTGYAEWQSAWQLTLATNLAAPAALSLLAAQSMAARKPPQTSEFGRGRIVNISSRGAFRGEPDAPAYAASKAGLNALSQSLARALAADEVYLYCVAPGWVETEMATSHLEGPEGPAILAQHPLGRVNRSDEIANAAVYCALDAPAAMTGCVIDVNGASYLRT